MHGNLLVGLGNLLNGTYVPVQKFQFDFKANRVEMCNGLYQSMITSIKGNKHPKIKQMSSFSHTRAIYCTVFALLYHALMLFIANNNVLSSFEHVRITTS